jgi:hypothetical protein
MSTVEITVSRLIDMLENYPRYYVVRIADRAYDEEGGVPIRVITVDDEQGTVDIHPDT